MREVAVRWKGRRNFKPYKLIILFLNFTLSFLTRLVERGGGCLLKLFIVHIIKQMP